MKIKTQVALPAASAAPSPPAGKEEARSATLTFGYTNHRGEWAVRHVDMTRDANPRVRFGFTKWHPEPQWLFRGFDLDRQEWRDFALKDIGAISPEALRAAEARAEAAERERDEAHHTAVYRTELLCDTRDELAALRKAVERARDDAQRALIIDGSDKAYRTYVERMVEDLTAALNLKGGDLNAP